MRCPSLVVLALLVCSGSMLGQTPSPNQAGYAQMVRYREQAQAAFGREMAREKADACQDASTTLAMLQCLEKENDSTMANYKTYTGSLRSLVGVVLSADPGDKAQAAQEQNDLDTTEALWGKYREAQCATAFNLFKGGTIAPVQASFCELMLVRSHMRELEKIYHDRLHN